jgi:hypothetical protein
MRPYADVLVILAVSMGLGACCWFSKRTCFPECPPPPAAKVVKVEKTCELPPLELPGFEQAGEGCPKDHVCFDRKNGAQLYVRLARLKDFAKLAPPTSRPADRVAESQPTR